MPVVIVRERLVSHTNLKNAGRFVNAENRSFKVTSAIPCTIKRQANGITNNHQRGSSRVFDSDFQSQTTTRQAITLFQGWMSINYNPYVVVSQTLEWPIDPLAMRFPM
jgi:hypothetical protein